MVRHHELPRGSVLFEPKMKSQRAKRAAVFDFASAFMSRALICSR